MDLHVQEGYLSSGVFKSKFDRGTEVIHEIFHGLEQFGGAYEDQEDVIYESLPESDCPDEDFPDGFFVTAPEGVGTWWGRLGSHGCADKLEKMSVHE